MSAARQRLAERLAQAYPVLDPTYHGYPQSPTPDQFVDLVDAGLDELVDRLTVDLNGVSDLERESIARLTNAAVNQDSLPLSLRQDMARVIGLVQRVTA